MSLPFDNMNDAESLANDEAGGEQPPEESNNRTFLIVAGILAALTVLILIGTGIYGLVIMPRSRAARQTEAAQAIAQNTAMAFSVQETQKAEAMQKPTHTATWTATSPAAATRTPTNTPVVARANTSTATVGAGSGASTPNFTQTVAALWTDEARKKGTVVATSTLLPKTGLADDIGLPGLMGVAVVMIVVIFIARRLRAAG